MEDYLELIGHPLEYGLIGRNVESFVDLRNQWEKMDKAGTPKDEISAYFTTAYNMIFKETSHWDIRVLNDIFKKKKGSHKTILDNVQKKDFGKITRVSADRISEVFKTASEIYDAEKMAGEPFKLINKALNTLKPLKLSDPNLKNPETRKALKELWTRVWKLSKGSE